jgi:hypothetical protein
MTKFLHCLDCGHTLSGLNLRIGKCNECREDAAREARKAWCIAPLHKSNYMLITQRSDLAGLNSKRGLVR